MSKNMLKYFWVSAFGTKIARHTLLIFPPYNVFIELDDQGQEDILVHQQTTVDNVKLSPN